jgi:phasin
MQNNPTRKVEEQVRKATEAVTAQSEQARRATEAVTTQSNEAFFETMRDCCSKAVKGAQDYHNRVIEFTQSNANRSFELAQKLLSVKSPSEFLEVASDHMRQQWEALAHEATQLTELSQKITLATAEPLKTGFEKVLQRAA